MTLGGVAEASTYKPLDERELVDLHQAVDEISLAAVNEHDIGRLFATIAARDAEIGRLTNACTLADRYINDRADERAATLSRAENAERRFIEACNSADKARARVTILDAALRTARDAIASLDEDAWRSFNVAEVLTICDNALETKP